MESIIVSCGHCGTKNRIPVLKQHLHPKCGRCQAVIDMTGRAEAIELDDAGFAGFVARATMPVLVDFYSPTCGPCQMLAPVITNLARRYLGRALVAKIDTSRNPMTASRFHIRGVPTLLFFRKGQMVDQVVGAVAEPLLAQKLDGFL